MKRFLEQIGHYYYFIKRVFSKPEKWKIFWKQCLTETSKLVIDSVPLIALISLFIGAVIVLQTAYNLESPFIPKMYVGYMARESLVLEFCSTMVCLILAGKIGSNIASEIGTMRISEQIDAMEMMGVNSATYLILPKITCTTILNPLLMIMSFIIGLLGGIIIVAITGVITLGQFIEGLRFAFNEYYILYSVIKTSVFSFIISSISGFYGYYATNGSLGVGRSSTTAIVVSSGLILIFNLILTQILL